MEGFNLELVKQEVAKRKQDAQIHETSTGSAPKDGKRFLSELVASVNQGVNTPTVNVINSIAENSDKYSPVKVMNGVTGNRPVESYTPPVNNGGHYQPQPQPQQILNEGGDRRDSYFDQQMEKGYELLRSRSQNQQAPANAGLSQVLNGYDGGNTNVNPSALNEHITKSINDLMGGSNMVKIVEGAYKNMINEMYTREKVENVLIEIVQGETFKKIMKKMIVDVLIEIQTRNKKA